MSLRMKAFGVSSVMSQLEALKTRGNPEYVVGTNVSYAAYVEFGTYKMASQPYLRPAVDKTQSNLGSIIRDASNLEAAIKTAALNVESEAKRRAPVDTGNLKNSIAAEKQ